MKAKEKHIGNVNVLRQLQKEQANMESMLGRLELGQKIKKGIDLKHKRLGERMFNIVFKYNQYVENNGILTYLYYS